jgi:hypothetical protein
MSNRPPASKIDHYFIYVRLLSSGHLKEIEIPAAKAFFYRQFLESAESADDKTIHAETIPAEIHLSHQEIQSRLVQIMRFPVDTPEQKADKTLAECCLRCFASHYIALACLELEQQFHAQFGFRAVDVLPYVLSDIDPRQSKQAYESAQKEQAQRQAGISKNQKFQVPLAIHIVQTFDPTKGNLTAWTKLLTLQHRELNRILAEYDIHRRTDWSILNSYTPARVKRLLSNVLTDAELYSVTAALESYHAVYRQARRQTKQTGRPCKEPDHAQLQAMVHDLEQRGFGGYSAEQIMQTLRLLALKLRYKQPKSGKAQELGQHQSQTAEEREQELFRQYQQELLSKCLHQAVKQVLDAHVDQLRQKKPPKNTEKLPKDRMFLEAMRLFYCEGKSMREIAQIIGRQQEYQVSRLLELKTLREHIRQPWYSLTCARIARLLDAHADPEQLPQKRQQIEQLIALQIDQIIAEERINAYRRQRASHTLFTESFRCYLVKTKHSGADF